MYMYVYCKYIHVQYSVHFNVDRKLTMYTNMLSINNVPHICTCTMYNMHINEQQYNVNV